MISFFNFIRNTFSNIFSNTETELYINSSNYNSNSKMDFEDKDDSDDLPTFFYILKKIVPPGHALTSFMRFSFEPLKHNRDRFKFCNDHVYKSIFLTQQKKDEHIDYINKAERVFQILKKPYLNRWRKKLRRFNTDTDLSLEPLSNNPTQTIEIIQNDWVYTLSIRDLMKIIKNSLLIADDMISNIQFPKNPYTNSRLPKAFLYKLYMKMHMNNMIIPILFTLFFRSGFDLKRLYLWNEGYFRNEIAYHYYSNESLDEKYESIIFMLRAYNSCFDFLTIHPNYPKKIVVEAFSQMLNTYSLQQYSLYPSLKAFLDKTIIQKIHDFEESYPNFGRVVDAVRPRTLDDKIPWEHLYVGTKFGPVQPEPKHTILDKKLLPATFICSNILARSLDGDYQSVSDIINDMVLNEMN